MSKYDFYIKSRDPFEAERELHREQISRLNREIVRLRLKCGEGFTENELMDGFTGIRTVKIGPERSAP